MSSSSRCGTQFGNYEIGELLGEGGMGAVYEATNTSIAKRVALKFLDKEASRDRDAVARFQRETEPASAVESSEQMRQVAQRLQAVSGRLTSLTERYRS